MKQFHKEEMFIIFGIKELFADSGHIHRTINTFFYLKCYQIFEISESNTEYKYKLDWNRILELRLLCLIKNKPAIKAKPVQYINL